MNRLRGLVVFFAMIFGCADAPEPEADVESQSGVGRLIAARGTVWVRPPGGQWRIATIDITLSSGALLFVEVTASATVRCADGRPVTVPSGYSGVEALCSRPRRTIGPR
jgi:hypothetical protein